GRRRPRRTAARRRARSRGRPAGRAARHRRRRDRRRRSEPARARLGRRDPRRRPAPRPRAARAAARRGRTSRRAERGGLMALRTVTLDNEPRRIALSPTEWRRRVERAAADAAIAIETGRLADLAALFADAATWEPQRAYQARRTLAETAFTSGTGGSPRRAAATYAVAAAALVEALEATPAEPVLLNYAGIFLFELGEAAAAEDLFRAAHRLDPELEHVADNLAQARARKGTLRAPADRAVALRARTLGARARRIAAAAKPASGLTLTLAMIVKDEEEMLPGCLAAVRDAVDEIIVVDTGSTDRTVEIAESFGARVIEFPWNGSFADARNVSLEHATGDWIVYLDADEHLVPEDGPLLRELLGRTWREGFYLAETNYTGGEEAGSAVAHLALRVFRNRPEYRFEGRIHEQKTGSMPMYLGERFETTSIRVRHYGYLRSRVSAREKSRRNIELLQQEAQEAPSPFVDFNLGSEYIALGQYDRARSHLDGAWNEIRRESSWSGKGYAPMLAARVVQARREAGDPIAAREAIAEALEVYPDHTELVLQNALCAQDLGELDEAVALAQSCLELGDAPARYAAAVGVGTYLARCLLAELFAVKGDEAAAADQYRRALEDHPDYVAPVLQLATLTLKRGGGVDATCARLAETRPSAALLLATALYEGGEIAEAETRFRALLAERPSLGVARIGLVEALLAQRRYPEAAAEAALEPADSPLAPAAASARLFALAAAGDVAGLAEALAVPAASAVHDLYRAWHAELAGSPEATLPAHSAPAAFTALEALIRVREFGAFER